MDHTAANRPAVSPGPSLPTMLGMQVLVTAAIAVLATAATAVLTFGGGPSVVTFLASVVALATLASLVGEGTQQLGSRLGPGATGVLQSALGNLPELFISLFALREGLVALVQASLVGSILGNSLLVLGLAFLVGGARHGTQTFHSETPKLIALMTLLAVAAVTVPTLANTFHSPAAGHIEQLSVVVAVVLLLVFVGSVRYILGGGTMGVSTDPEAGHGQWPMWLAVVILAAGGIAAAFVSDWFVEALKPATTSIGLAEGFTGLVIVALAGNAVENVVGIQFAAQNKADLAVSVILNSSLQVALALIPALVLLSLIVGGSHLTLALSPLLVVALALSALLGAFITYDGESTWIEGVALIGLYVILAASFWWG